MGEKERFEGCLLGGAAGDALGYPVEFMLAKEIFAKYGSQGITEYKLKNGVAQISDDTQMTLFTANGLILGDAEYEDVDYIEDMYLEWYLTQTHMYPLPEGKYYSWLVNVPEMFAQRAPGLTCMDQMGKIYEEKKKCEKGGYSFNSYSLPQNESKGCGAVMKAAPFGLFFATKDADLIFKNDLRVEHSTKMIHGHPMALIAATAFAHIILLITANEEMEIAEAVSTTMVSMNEIYGPSDRRPDTDYYKSQEKAMTELLALINKAMELAKQDVNDVDAISQLGEGWISEEALAIAVYCAIKYQDDFDKALIAAVNHDGDSDSIGSITGNMVGAYLGIDGIPNKYKEKLELKKVILAMADDLYYTKYRYVNNNADKLSVRKYGSSIKPRKFTIRKFPRKTNFSEDYLLYKLQQNWYSGDNSPEWLGDMIFLPKEESPESTGEFLDYWNQLLSAKPKFREMKTLWDAHDKYCAQRKEKLEIYRSKSLAGIKKIKKVYLKGNWSSCWTKPNPEDESDQIISISESGRVRFTAKHESRLIKDIKKTVNISREDVDEIFKTFLAYFATEPKNWYTDGTCDWGGLYWHLTVTDANGKEYHLQNSGDMKVNDSSVLKCIADKIKIENFKTFWF